MTWMIGWVIIVLSGLGISVGIILPMAATTWRDRTGRSRNTWVLNNRRPLHVCKRPYSPRKGTRAWRCRCGQLWRPKLKWIDLGGCVWGWTPITEEQLTEIDE